MAGPTTTPINRGRTLAGPTGSAGPRRFYFSRTAGRAEPLDHGHGLLERLLAFFAFALLVAFYVALPSLKFAGLPMRGVLALAVLAFLLVARTSVAATAVRRYFPLIGLAAGLALLGLFVSVVNGNPPDIIIKSLLEVHFQLVILILVAAILAEICGARLCMWAIVAVICTSAFFAVLQMLDVTVAWEIRRSLGPLSKEELRPSMVDWRPAGLSYSPIQLSTQLCQIGRAHV